MDISEEKSLLREEAKRINEGLSQEEVLKSNEAIIQAVLRNKAYKDSTSLFVYVSMEKEPDTLKLIREALNSGKEVYVPKCGKKPYMKAVRINDLKDLHPGRFGIPEPESDEGYEGRIDVALVPCVAASPNGKRLGHGGGYYDHFLRDREICKLCLCRKKLLKSDLPVDEFDVIMDEIITD